MASAKKKGSTTRPRKPEEERRRQINTTISPANFEYIQSQIMSQTHPDARYNTLAAALDQAIIALKEKNQRENKRTRT